MENHIFYDGISFAEKYGVCPEQYSNITIMECNFSNRVYNQLMRNGVTTLEMLLKLSVEKISNFKNIGKTSIKEILNFCANLQDNSYLEASKSTSDIHRTSISSMQHDTTSGYISLFREHRDKIAMGDFSFIDAEDADVSLTNVLNKYKEAYEILDCELALECIFSPERIDPFISAFSVFSYQAKKINELYELFNKIPEHRKNNKTYGYIQAFTINKNKRNILYNLCVSEDSSLADMCKCGNTYTDDDFLLLKQFLKWCSFDLNREIELLFSSLYTNNMQTVIQMRATNHTLEEAGTVLGITRERVRQIENKAKIKFSKLHSKVLVVSKISAERNGDQVLTPAEIEEYCGSVATELVYLLRSYPSPNYTYDKQLDVFIVGDDSMRDRAQEIVDSYPEIISENELQSMLLSSAEENDITTEILEKAFMSVYRRKGDMYYKNRLSLSKIYEKIITENYPDGFRVYDEEELRAFRDIIEREYGDIGLPENNRALSARIADFCVLCGRGVYRIKQKEYIPKSLAKKIFDYINNSENQIFLTNTLFRLFEEELVAAGVDNKYYLQGILRELYGDKFVFRRDYISKDINITSVYSALVAFVKKFDFPVSKSKIQEEFPGITDVVINFAMTDPCILNYFGEYLHDSKLTIFDYEKEYLQDVVGNLVSDNKVHHSKDLYDIIYNERPEIFTRNAAIYPFAVFSIVENLLRDKFQFSRPYIANNGVEIENTAERLHEFIYSKDKISVNEISEFARENHFQIQSLLDYANSCNDEFLLIDNDFLMKIDLIGIDETKALAVDEIISNEITQTVPIKNLSVWEKLPAINVPWSDWLIYSVIMKWGKKTIVSTSYHQMKLSVPLIAPVDNFDPMAYQYVETERSNDSFETDDLSNLDSLLEGIIDEDFLTDF